MSVKLSQLKQEVIRAIVKVGDDEVKILNPNGEIKAQVIDLIKEGQKEGVEPEADKLFSFLLSTLTNIEIDMSEIVDVMASPSKEMIEVISHLNSIMQDIVYEIIVEQQMSLSMVEKTIMGKEISDKVEKINSMVKEVEGKTDKILN